MNGHRHLLIWLLTWLKCVWAHDTGSCSLSCGGDGWSAAEVSCVRVQTSHNCRKCHVVCCLIWPWYAWTQTGDIVAQNISLCSNRCTPGDVQSCWTLCNNSNAPWGSCREDVMHFISASIKYAWYMKNSTHVAGSRHQHLHCENNFGDFWHSDKYNQLVLSLSPHTGHCP